LSKAKHTTQSKIDQNKILHGIDLEKKAIAHQIYIALLQAINELEFMILVLAKMISILLDGPVCLLRQVKAWVERLKTPPTENAKIFFNDTEGSK